MTKVTTCQTKVAYDTQFEAELAIAKVEEIWGDEMRAYQCWPWGHWHLTHKDRQKRLGYGNAFTICPGCAVMMKKTRMPKHKCGRMKK